MRRALGTAHPDKLGMTAGLHVHDEVPGVKRHTKADGVEAMHGGA